MFLNNILVKKNFLRFERCIASTPEPITIVFISNCLLQFGCLYPKPRFFRLYHKMGSQSSFSKINSKLCKIVEIFCQNRVDFKNDSKQLLCIYSSQKYKFCKNFHKIGSVTCVLALDLHNKNILTKIKVTKMLGL